MPTTCPQCAAILNIAEAFCSRCGWNAPYLVRRRSPSHREMTFVERYRGTDFESRQRVAVATSEGITRGRLFVLVSFASLTTLAVTVVLAQPPM